LFLMTRAATAPVLKIASWPTATLHSYARGPLVGVLMPRINDHRELHQLYSPAERRALFPHADWQFLIHCAMNCAAAFETIHGQGHVVGDVNESGLLVSDEAMVKLIDCDSFQIADKGRVYRCEVGVPHYTPPELQGVSDLGTIDRTANHDLFGLAVLIFQLLFMGRHPFAGRFLGSGEMPLERAIAQGRFAFSSRAQALEMMPPPGSLPLGVLPEELSEYFDRAFLVHPSAPPWRPAAAQWRSALLSLRNNLRACPVNDRHKFPRHLGSCPWCDLVRQGSPNFFVSLKATATASSELAPVDFGMLLGCVESLMTLPESPPQYPVIALTPAPLPVGAQEYGVIRRILASAAVACAAAAIVGLWLHLVVVIAGAVCCVGLNIALALLAMKSPLKMEKRRRMAVQQTLAARLDSLAQARRQAFAPYRAEVAQAQSQLASLREQAEQLSGTLEGRKRDLLSEARSHQRDEYLEQFLLAKASLQELSPSRQVMLSSYGVETAADATPTRLGQVPGLALNVTEAILRWRNALAAGFSPQSGQVPAQEWAKLIEEFRGCQQHVTGGIRGLYQRLDAVRQKTATAIQEIDQQIMVLIPKVEQARADAELLGS
jgi:DNA-binding helix-hairpin-helix protein with protein kinase domain